MNLLRNNNGIALITSLMFTVITIVITMSLLYMVTSSIKTSGAVKRYKTITEAAYGGTDIVVKDLISASFVFHDYSTSANPYTKYMVDRFASVGNYTPTFSNCFRTKLTYPKNKWTAACSNATLNAKESSDASFVLNSASGSPFSVYSKIVDTMERKFTVLESYSAVGGQAKRAKTISIAGNSDTVQTVLESGSTTDGAGVTVPHYPYMYRIEIQAERQQNSAEKSKISVQYAY